MRFLKNRDGSASSINAEKSSRRTHVSTGLSCERSLATLVESFGDYRRLETRLLCGLDEQRQYALTARSRSFSIKKLEGAEIGELLERVRDKCEYCL